MSIRRATEKMLSSSDALRPFPEHSIVALLSGFTLEDGRLLPPKTEGTVVGVWANGEAYEVEFDKPFHAVVTIPAAKLRSTERRPV
jgi:hypothetical protein